MQLSRIGDDVRSFTIWGECPHCSPVQSSFETVTKAFSTQIRGWDYLIAVAQCVACRKFILAAIGSTGGSWEYKFHYPVGKPNEEVAKEIPDHIRPDFQEALRCHWGRSYNATAEMCRRVVEASCIHLGAPYRKVLNDMIDWLEENRKITPGLKDVAHQIRLGGDRAAHPPENPNEEPKYEPPTIIGEEHADAIVDFTQHFLDHVYVIPARLPKFNFEKPKKLNHGN